MKARVVRYNDRFQLLLCSGIIKELDAFGINDFFETFDSPEHYENGPGWTFPISIEQYNGETVAYVNEDTQLVISNSACYRELCSGTPVKMVTAAEYADMYDKKAGIIKRFCREGRFQGAVMQGTTWMIPANAPYPANSRKKTISDSIPSRK